MAEYPKRQGTARTAETGINAVSTIVNDDLRWIFRRTPSEVDFGVDAYIDVVLDDGSVSGQSLAVQVKSGESYLRDEIELGFTFYGERKHLNYYANLPMPLLIILHDPTTKSTFWELFLPEKTEKTREGWRMIIPKDKQFSERTKAQLLELVGPPVDVTQDLERLWEFERAMADASYIHYVIDRADVEIHNTADIASFFLRLQLNPRTTRALQGKIEISVWGYDDDDDVELWEVKEVREWFTKAINDLPYWLYFFKTKPTPSSIRLLFAVLCSTRRVHTDHSRRIKLEYDGVKMARLLEHGFAGLNEMTERLGMSEEENKRISYELMDILEIPHSA